MSLISALNVGKSALNAHQSAIQVISNNIANAADENYVRQTVNLGSNGDVMDSSGQFLGSGVGVSSITRQINEALEDRIRSSMSDQSSASIANDVLSQVEKVFDALGDKDIWSQIGAFFKGWSDLANKPQDVSQRQVVLQEGQQVASTFQSVRQQLTDISQNVVSQVTVLANEANNLCDQVANLNQKIASAEAVGTATAANLRNDRDAILKNLSQIMDIKVQDTGNGMVNVMMNSQTIVSQGQSFGVKTVGQTEEGQTGIALSTAQTGAILSVSSGQIGALLEFSRDPAEAISQVDALASSFIFQLNKLHASGQGLTGMTSATATDIASDPSVALNAAGLDFTPQNGSFVLQVKNKNTNLSTSTLIKVDLDGLNSDDTTLASLAAQLASVDGVSASSAGGKLSINADNGFEFSFTQDSSNILASLGINTFFTGSDASNIAVNSAIKSNLSLIAASANGEKTNNSNALAIAALADASVESLNGMSISEAYQSLVDSVGVAASNAQTNEEASTSVLDALNTQRNSISGVSLDEEAISLLREQRSYQAAAKIISTIDQLMNVLLNMV